MEDRQAISLLDPPTCPSPPPACPTCFAAFRQAIEGPTSSGRSLPRAASPQLAGGRAAGLALPTGGRFSRGRHSVPYTRPAFRRRGSGPICGAILLAPTSATRNGLSGWWGFQQVLALAGQRARLSRASPTPCRPGQRPARASDGSYWLWFRAMARPASCTSSTAAACTAPASSANAARAQPRPDALPAGAAARPAATGGRRDAQARRHRLHGNRLRQLVVTTVNDLVATGGPAPWFEGPADRLHDVWQPGNWLYMRRAWYRPRGGRRFDPAKTGPRARSGRPLPQGCVEPP